MQCVCEHYSLALVVARTAALLMEMRARLQGRRGVAADDGDEDEDLGSRAR